MKRKIGIVALALMLVAVFVGLVACDNPATDNTAYTITVKAADNGKVAVNAKSATAGTEITVTVTANTGYKVSEVKMNGTALTVTDGKATFKMPAANVEITATFVLEEQPAPGQHKVTVSTVKGGEVSADKAVAVKDEIVTLTVNAAFGYTLTDVKLNGEVLVAKDGVYSFAMPDSDVTVTATFATAANVSTDAAPQNATARLTSRAMAGALATADVVLAYTDNGLSLTAYVTDSVVTSADGVGLYIGRNAYAGGSIGSDNIGVELLVSGSKVYKVTNGAYAADAETAIDGATIVAWVVDGEVVGYKATFEVPYTTLGTNKETAENNLTVLPVLSNNDRTMANVAAYGNGEIGNADTYYLLKDGKLSDNYYLYGAGMLGKGDTAIETGRGWDLTEDYAETDVNYANRKAVLNGNDGDNNIVMYRTKGTSLYAKATFKLTGMGNTSENYGKFGIMLFDGASQNGVFFYVDAVIGNDTTPKDIGMISGRSLGYNVGHGSWSASWINLAGTGEAFDLTTKTITLGLTAHDGMIFMWLGDKLVGQTAFDASENAVMGFKSFGYTMEVTNYSVTNDVTSDEFQSHVKEVNREDLDVLFLGDSYMDFWKNLGGEDGMGWRLQTVAIEKKANIGVGGTQINYWTDSVTLLSKLYNPEKFVFHIGVNDIDDGSTTAETAFDRFKKMTTAYHEVFPTAEIYWVSLIHNTMFAAKCAEYDKMNKLVEDYAKDLAWLIYVDVTSVGVNSDGTTRADMLYDGLHLNKEWGYPQWGKLIMKAIGYPQSAGNDTVGDYDSTHVSNGAWKYNEDGTVTNDGEGAQVLWFKGMQPSANFYLTANVTSPNKTLVSDVWTKVGMFAANSTYKVFGYIDVADSIAAADRRFGQIVYSRTATNDFNITCDAGWQWNKQGAGSSTDILIESTTAKLGIAKVGNTMYLFVNDKLVSSLVLEGTENDTFIGGVMGFHRNMTVSNVAATTGTADEIGTMLGLKAADGVTLDGVADESIWTEEVLGNTQNFAARTNGGHFTIAAVKGSNGVYFYANIWHEAAIGTVLQGDGSAWWNYLNIEFRTGTNQDAQRAVWFNNGKAYGLGGVVAGDIVTTKDGSLNKTSVEFFIPYVYFDGYTSESEEISVKMHGWVSDLSNNFNWEAIEKYATVSVHGMRYPHTVTVNEVTGATVEVDKTTARKGDIVNIAITAEEGIIINKVLVNGKAIEAVDGKYSFVMPDGDVTITVELKGRFKVDVSAVSDKLTADNYSPLEGDTVTFASVAPWNIVNLYVGGKKVEATDGVYKVVVNSDITVTADFGMVYGNKTEGAIKTDGVPEESYGEEFFTRVSGDRSMSVRSVITDDGIWVYTVARTATNPQNDKNFWNNVNFEFYVAGMRFAVNNSNQIVASATDGANPVDGYYYEIATVSGKYQHTIELFIAKETLGTAWNAERMQLNYAWCIANEKAHVIDCSNARYDASYWWGQARIGGAADADWQWGSGYNRPANLFATKTGLVTTANENPADEQIDGVASEKYGSTWVETGSYDKAHVKVQGFVGSDGLYFLLTINHKNKSSFADGWAANDNIEFVVNNTWAAITFVEGQLRGSGLITKSYYNCTGTEGNYTTTAEFFIPIASPENVYGIRFGIAGAGFGGWQEGYWGDRYIRVTANGVGSENVEQIADNINIDGRLDDEFWNGTTKWENTNTSTRTNGVTAYTQAKLGDAGVYIAVTMYHNTGYSDKIQGDGTAWWNYVNIEFRFGTNWDASAQRACCIWNNGVAGCDFAYTSAASDVEGYTYKTVFEIFVAKANLGEYVNAEEVPLMVSAVADGGWGWILDPWVNATQPNTVTRTDFVRK